MKFPGMVLKNKTEQVLHLLAHQKWISHLNIKWDISFIFSVDATYSTGLGRLVNDEEAAKANCKAVVFDKCVDGLKLCLFATKDIDADSELRYDYGVSNLPWRNKVHVGTLIAN